MAGREVPLPADAGDHTPREDGARLVDQEGQPIYMGAVAMMNGMTMAERRRKDAKRELLKAGLAEQVEEKQREKRLLDRSQRQCVRWLRERRWQGSESTLAERRWQGSEST